MDGIDWTFTVAASTLLWTVIAFVFTRRLQREQLNQTAQVSSREQFTQKLHGAIEMCLAGDRLANRVGTTLLEDLMYDTAVRESDQVLAGKVVQQVKDSIVRGGDGDA